MSANTHTTEPEERKPPTIADIVREKTGDGALIIDFFTDVMTGRIEGAELCHRIDAAKQLVKYGSKDAAEFLAKYKGVPCGHSINGRPDPADPCSAEDRSLVAVTLNAPPTLTRDFLTVLSGIDEFLMARLIRAQTVDGGTVIEFLDDVMQDRTDGFKTHHRIAAAKELIVHIVRDEQPSHTPSPSTRETDKRGDSTAVGADPCVRPLPGSQTPSPSTGEGWGEGAPPPLPQGEGWGEGDSPVVPAQTEGNPDNSLSSFPRKREPRGAGWLDPARLEHMLSSTHPSFPRRREPRGAAGPVTPQPTPLTLSPTQPSFPPILPSFPRKREPIPGPSLWESLPPSSRVRIPSPLILTLPKDPRTRLDGPERDAPEHNVAGTEPPRPPLSERGPSETKRKSRTKNSSSTGTSQTPIAHPSTPHTPAAHRPGNRDPTTQLNSERGRGLLPPLP